jgi:hypothetical protein
MDRLTNQALLKAAGEVNPLPFLPPTAAARLMDEGVQP